MKMNIVKDKVFYSSRDMVIVAPSLSCDMGDISQLRDGATGDFVLSYVHQNHEIIENNV
jgi:hypothetical protein